MVLENKSSELYYKYVQFCKNNCLMTEKKGNLTKVIESAGMKKLSFHN